MRTGGTYRQAAVTSIAQDGRRPDVRLSDGSRLQADRFVFACGPWLGRLVPGCDRLAVRSTRQEVFYFGTPAGDDRFVEPGCPSGWTLATVSSTASPAICTVGSKSLMTREGRSSIRPTGTGIRPARWSAGSARS